MKGNGLTEGEVLRTKERGMRRAATARFVDKSGLSTDRAGRRAAKRRCFREDTRRSGKTRENARRRRPNRRRTFERRLEGEEEGLAGPCGGERPQARDTVQPQSCIRKRAAIICRPSADAAARRSPTAS